MDQVTRTHHAASPASATATGIGVALLRTLAVALLAVLVPSLGTAQDNEVTKMLDSSLGPKVRELAATLADLDDAGLLPSRTVVVLPPLTNGRNGLGATGAGDSVARYIATKLQDLTTNRFRLVYGPLVRERFRSGLLSLGTYRSTADGLESGRTLNAGFIVAGTLQYERPSSKYQYTLDMKGALVPGGDGYAWDSGRLVLLQQGHNAFSRFDSSNNVESSVPFADDPRVVGNDPSEAEREAILEDSLYATLEEVVADFRGLVESEIAAGRYPELDSGRSAVLPALDESGAASSFSDDLHDLLVTEFDALGPEQLARQLDRSRDLDRSLGELVTYGVEPDQCAALNLAHYLSATYSIDGSGSRRRGRSNLRITLEIRNCEEQFVSRRFTVDLGGAADMLKTWTEAPGGLTFEPVQLDGRELLSRKLRRLMPATLIEAGIDLDTASVRLLPLESPATGSIMFAFGEVRAQLARARLDVERRADEAQVAAEEALRSEEFEVAIDVLGGMTFKSWEHARRQLILLSWKNLVLSETFDLGRTLQQDYIVDISKVAKNVQDVPQSLPAAEIELGTIRSVDSSEEVDIFLLSEPDYMLGVRFVDVGQRSCLIAQLYDVEDAARVFYHQRVDLTREETETIKQLLGPSSNWSGPDRLRSLLGLEDGRGSAPSSGFDVPAERGVLDGVTVHVHFQGSVGEEIANALHDTLVSFPFDLPGTVRHVRNDWSEVSPKMNSRFEIRYPESQGAAGLAAAEALMRVLVGEAGGWIEPSAPAAARRLGPHTLAVPSFGSLADTPSAEQPPTLLVLIRG